MDTMEGHLLSTLSINPTDHFLRISFGLFNGSKEWKMTVAEKNDRLIRKFAR